MILYQYNKYPFKVAVNSLPGDIVNDLFGNIYEISKTQDVIKKSNSVLIPNETILGLSEMLYKKLFIPLSDKSLYAGILQEISQEDEG